MNRRKQPPQPDMLADITNLSQFPRRKQRQPGKFDGPRNPREFRFLQTVLHRHLTREELDAVSGASNGPEVVNKLRERGLELPCFRVGCIDRDGQKVERGVYALTHADRQAVARALHDKGRPAAAQGAIRKTTAKKGRGSRGE
ncbi:hypothetical protein [Acidithiobacillus acidisediminis]|uniref:hypothetical protein n=1 Tax=Acidithiobacillus acidisediminis TaxID=2937799 RepID=UPI00200E4446|nr:hypothetical protein [Acidithiobacillus sp. S30A2]